MSAAIEQTAGKVKKIYALLERFKDQVQTLAQQFAAFASTDHQLLDMLGHYENLATGDSAVISHPDRKDIKATLEQMPAKMRNPYSEVRRWLKWELLDMQAVLEAIDLKTQVDRRRVATQKKVAQMNQEIKDLQQGKQNIKHLKHLFYSQDEKAKRVAALRSQIDHYMLDSDDTDQIYKIIVFYQHERLLPWFKETRVKADRKSVV